MNTTHHTPLDAAFIVTDGFHPLDLFGPLSAWVQAAQCVGQTFRYNILSLKQTQVTSDTGVAILADAVLERPVMARQVILPGGIGPRSTQLNAALKSTLNAMCSQAQRVASVCTGTFLLAQLDCARGRHVTTHWKHTEELKRRHPDLQVQAERLYINDHGLWSSGGVTAGVDMSLAMIKTDYGSAVAAEVARELLVFLHRPGNQNQFSRPLQVQSFNDQRLAGLLQWIQNNLHRRFTLDDLAAQANYSARHLSRLFHHAFRCTPSALIEQLRMDRARVLLAEGNSRIGAIAGALGYSHSDSFRRAFEKHYGLSPQAYRQCAGHDVAKA